MFRLRLSHNNILSLYYAMTPALPPAKRVRSSEATPGWVVPMLADPRMVGRQRKSLETLVDDSLFSERERTLTWRSMLRLAKKPQWFGLTAAADSKGWTAVGPPPRQDAATQASEAAAAGAAATAVPAAATDRVAVTHAVAAADVQAAKVDVTPAAGMRATADAAAAPVTAAEASLALAPGAAAEASWSVAADKAAAAHATAAMDAMAATGAAVVAGTTTDAVLAALVRRLLRHAHFSRRPRNHRHCPRYHGRRRNQHGRRLGVLPLDRFWCPRTSQRKTPAQLNFSTQNSCVQ